MTGFAGVSNQPGKRCELVVEKAERELEANYENLPGKYRSWFDRLTTNGSLGRPILGFVEGLGANGLNLFSEQAG